MELGYEPEARKAYSGNTTQSYQDISDTSSFDSSNGRHYIDLWSDTSLLSTTGRAALFATQCLFCKTYPVRWSEKLAKSGSGRNVYRSNMENGDIDSRFFSCLYHGSSFEPIFLIFRFHIATGIRLVPADEGKSPIPKTLRNERTEYG